MSNLVEHARRELLLSGQFATDPAYAQSIVAAVAAFASYGHSGGSAEVAIEQIHDLLRYRTLAPLTSYPGEWEDRSDTSGTPLWQNRRDPAAMSRDGGETWYFVDGREMLNKTVRITRESALAHAVRCLLGVESRELPAAHIQAQAQVAVAWATIAANLKKGEAIVSDGGALNMTHEMG